MNIDDVMLLN